MKANVAGKRIANPKKLLRDADEPEIDETKKGILDGPRLARDPIFELGSNPVRCKTPDASGDLDKYLYPANRKN